MCRATVWINQHPHCQFFRPFSMETCTKPLRGSFSPSTAECSAERRWLVLDRRLRMGEGSASGTPWGEGLAAQLLKAGESSFALDKENKCGPIGEPDEGQSTWQ